MRAAASLIALCLSALASMSAHAEDWPMYGQNLEHTFSNKQSQINPLDVWLLGPAWTFPTKDAVSASPTVVNGVVYVGSWDGFFYALDANPREPRRVVWQYPVDCQKTVVPVPPTCPHLVPVRPRELSDGGIITSSAAVVNGVVYFGAGKTLYALRADTGQLLWKTVICGRPEGTPQKPNCETDEDDPTRIFSSPAVAGGMVFVGHTADGADRYRGGFVAVNATTGALAWRFEVDPIVDSWNRVTGVNNRGCGSVWSSPAVDESRELVFFATGDCKEDATPPFHEAVIALDMAGNLKWAFRPRKTDKCDFDFGASPNIIDFGIPGFGPFVGIGGKDGTYYLLAEEDFPGEKDGALIWSKRVVFGGSIGNYALDKAPSPRQYRLNEDGLPCNSLTRFSPTPTKPANS